MKVTLLESSVGAGKNQQILASYSINDTVSIDGGSIGFVTPLDVQRRIQHVFLSHSHLDHIASVPIFIDNTYIHGPTCPSVYANAPTIDVLRTDIFNDRVWPDMIRLSGEESPFLRLQELVPEVPVSVDGLTITPVSINHVVPTVGFIVSDGSTSVAFVSDTSPTERIWELINAEPNLRAVFLECSFPNSMEWLAAKAMHLCPKLFEAELKKLKRDVEIIAIHVKIAFEPQILKELGDLAIPRLTIGQPGAVFDFK